MDLPALSHRKLWNSIETRLDSHHSHWRERVDQFGQVRAVEERSEGRIWSDDQVFKGVLLAVLSSNTVWSKIEGVLPHLPELFDGFSLGAYASHSGREIDNRFVPWFEARRAGSPSLRGGLVNLIGAAEKLLRYSERNGAADGYFTSLVQQCAGDPKQAALQLGSPGSYKLPSLGVALAAEALKNLGFAVAKPDRHVLRAVGSFGLVRFNRWEPGSWGKPLSTSGAKLLEVMTVAERIADAAETPVVLVDNAIWLLCAKDEMHLANSELAAIANGISTPAPAGPLRRTTNEERLSVSPRPSRSSAPDTSKDPDYSVYPGWVNASEESRTLYRELKTIVDQLGRVRTDVSTTVISFKCIGASGHRAPVFAYVYLRMRSGLQVQVHEQHVRDFPLEDGFTRLYDHGQYRAIAIRNREQLHKAEPLLLAAFNARSTA